MFSKKARVVLDALWLLSFLAAWGLLIALWDTRWAVFLVPLFAAFLLGLSEVYHQGVHLNLFARNRAWNRRVGKVAAAMLRLDYDMYREFHLEHHRRVNTPGDTEGEIYRDPVFREVSEGWRGLSPWRKVARTVRLARHVDAVLAEFGGRLPFVQAVRWSIPLLIAGIGWLEGLSPLMIAAKVVVAWRLPLLLLLLMDIILVQSEHYGTAAAEGGEHGVPNEEQYGLSWNLKVPQLVGVLLLRRNVHAEHHASPGIHWTEARDRGLGRSLPLSAYLRRLWTEGPRAFPEPGAERRA